MKKIIKYLRESRQELSKVTWPTKQHTINSTIMVIVVSVGIAAFLGGVDYGLNNLLEFLLANF
ncbi:preprotein translocase subunit SecE [Patescibacteria group bacterium]|nr:preprotein translocase subunit SecE [Patescibacteria group bacterium]